MPAKSRIITATKNITKLPPVPSPKPRPLSKEAITLPLAQYTSLLGTQSLLLLFSALYLPRSTISLLGEGFLPTQQSSLDRPQHPFLIPLTASPEITLGWVCLGSAFVTSWWAGHVRIWAQAEGLRKDEPTQEDTAPPTAAVNAARTKALWHAWTATFAASPLFYFMLVLFGAPINSHFMATFFMGLLLSILTVYTPVYSLGLPSLDSDSHSLAERLTYSRLFSEFNARSPLERALVYPVLGCLIGCGVGAFVLPLDWDRPWQAWPLIPAFGSIVGYILGSVCSLVWSTTHFFASAGRDEQKSQK